MDPSGNSDYTEPTVIGTSRPDAETVNVSARLSPFRLETIREHVPFGATVAEIIKLVSHRGTFIGEPRAWIDGQEVPVEFLDRVRPRAGQILEIAGVPGNMPGVGKDARLRAILNIVTAGIGIAANEIIGGVWGGVAGVVISLLGMLLWNALIPVRSPRLIERSRLTGSGNAIEPYAVVPYVVGKHLITLRMAARPYTSLEGENQFLHLLFCMGRGPMRLHNVYIGATPIEQVAGVTWTWFKSGSNRGDTVYRNDIQESSVQAVVPGAKSILLDGDVAILNVGEGIDVDQEFEDWTSPVMVRDTFADDQPTFADPESYSVNEVGTITINSGVWEAGTARWEVTFFASDRGVVRPVPDACEAISMDLLFADGLRKENEDGDLEEAAVFCNLKYRMQGMSAWFDFLAYGPRQETETFWGGTPALTVSQTPIERVQRVRDSITGVGNSMFMDDIMFYGVPRDLSPSEYTVNPLTGAVTRVDAQNWAVPEFKYVAVSKNDVIPLIDKIYLLQYGMYPIKPGSIPTVKYAKQVTFLPPIVTQYETINPLLYSVVNPDRNIIEHSTLWPTFPSVWWGIGQIGPRGYRVEWQGADRTEYNLAQAANSPLRRRWRVTYEWNPLGQLAQSLDLATVQSHLEECVTVLNEICAAVKLELEADRKIVGAYRDKLIELITNVQARIPSIDPTGADVTLQALINDLVDLNGNDEGLGELRLLLLDYTTVSDPDDSVIVVQNDLSGAVISMIDVLVSLYNYLRDEPDDAETRQPIYPDAQKFGHLQAFSLFAGRFGSGFADTDFSFRDTNEGLIHRSIHWYTAPGEYEVMLTRNSPPNGEPQPMDGNTYTTEMTWGVVRSEGVSNAVTLDDVNLIGMKILASERLSGNLDDVTAVVQQLVPVWDENLTLWKVTQDMTANPAWYFLHVLMGGMNRRPVQADYPVYSGGDWVRDRIDMASILEWAALCEEKQWYVNGAFEEATTVMEALKAICAAGRASLALPDGRYGVVIDKDQTEAGPAQLFTPRNVRNLTVTRAFIEEPHALKVQFLNEEERYQQDEVIVYDDSHNLDGTPELMVENLDGGTDTLAVTWGPIDESEGVDSVVDLDDMSVVDPELYTVDAEAGTVTLLSGTWGAGEARWRVVYWAARTTATLFESVTAPMITSKSQAWRYGRYLIAVARLRPRRIEFTADWEQLRCNRGDMVTVQHYVPLIGLASGARVTGFVLTDPEDPESDPIGIVIDDLWQIEADKTYAITIRYSDGEVRQLEIDSSTPGITDSFVFIETPLPQSTGGREIRIGDLCAFGELDLVTRNMTVRSLHPGANCETQLVCVDHAPEVHQAEEKPIPEFDPGITLPPSYELETPEPPVIESITSDETALTIGQDGFIANIRIVVATPPDNVGDEIQPAFLQMQWRRYSTQGDGTWTREPEVPADVRQAWVRDATQGARYDVRVRWRTAESRISEWTYEYEHLVIGQSSPPPNVTNFRAVDSILAWDYAFKPVDFRGYQIRSLPGFVEGVDVWALGAPIHGGVVTEETFDITNMFSGGYRTFAIKAVDASGNESVSAAIVVVDTGTGSQGVIVLEQNEKALDWPGSISAGEVDPDTDDIIGENLGGGLFWNPDPDVVFWSEEEDQPFWNFTYGSITYLWTVETPAGSGGATLQIDIAAAVPFGGVVWLGVYDGFDVREFGGSMAVEAETVYTFVLTIVSPDGDFTEPPRLTGLVARVVGAAIANEQLSDMDAGTFKARSTSSAGTPEDLDADAASAILDTAADPFVRASAGGAGGITQLTGAVTAGPGTGVQAATIADEAVTNAKLAHVAEGVIKGRLSAGAGDVEDLDADDVSDILDDATDPFMRTSAATAGMNQLTGDVTAGPGTGSQAATIANDAVTNAKAANMAQATIKGRQAGSGTGDPEDLTATQVRTILNVADGANAYVHPNHTGDVTSSGDGAQTIANNAVTYAKMQNVSATDKVLGRSTAGSGDVEEIACTAAGRALLDDATAADQRTTLGLSKYTEWSIYRDADGYEIVPAFTAPAGAPVWTTLRAARTQLWLIPFDKDAVETVAMRFSAPPDYAGQQLKFTIFWTATSGTSGDVIWDVYTAEFANDATLDEASVGSGTVTDSFIAQKDMHICSCNVTPYNASADGFIHAYMRRRATDGADTFDADAQLIGVRISYA